MSGGKQTTWGIDVVGTVAGGWQTPGFPLAWGGKWLSKDLRTFEVNTPEAATLFDLPALLGTRTATSTSTSTMAATGPYPRRIRWRIV